ncbi:MAG: hypothetical protein IPI45_04545 [Saprospiraceae bacterium]|nr:hypothetical protein [Saprospiraceae bacterium]MBK7737032.1 hypothetical protein [Saprospiraceae bacterium]MBK7914373.1 hypothetical protein [Saprospiraceae bacterium]
MEVVKVFAQFGVPTMVLGFVLWFLLKPLVQVLIKNIEVQTDALSKITHNLSNISEELAEVKDSLHAMKQDIKEIKNSK